YAFTQQHILQREDDLHALVQVAWHPIGAPEIDLLLSAVGKVIDAAVLQKAPHDTADPNVIADPAYAGPQGANTAHNQVDLYTRLGRTVERHNDVLVEQRIHLGYDVCRPFMTRVLRLAGDESQAVLG